MDAGDGRKREASAAGIYVNATRVAIVAIAILAAPLNAVALPDEDIAVRVARSGGEIVVDIDCPVRAPLPVIWEVLTDYDNMAKFVSNLQWSGVLHRSDNLLTVRQTGKASRGPFSVSFDNVREIELVPFVEIRSRLVSGDLKASAFTTHVVETGGIVHISNSGRYTPNMWVPPLIGPALIEAETRKQFAEIRTEIVRRAAKIAAGLP
jgi:hypothetical protein